MNDKSEESAGIRPVDKNGYSLTNDAEAKEQIMDLLKVIKNKMLKLKELNDKTNKIIELAKKMDATFGYRYKEDHLRLAIMAGINDAVNESKKDHT